MNGTQIRGHLERLVQRRGGNKALLLIAQKRHHRYQRGADSAHDSKLAHQRRADQLLAARRRDDAERETELAHRAEVRMVRRHKKALFWKGRIRVLVRHNHVLEDKIDRVQAELAEWNRRHVRVIGNHVEGGSPGDRFIAACLRAVEACNEGMPNGRRNFYSMWDGGFDCKHELHEGPPYGERSDCSLSLKGWCYSAGLPSPDGFSYDAGGSTATLVYPQNGWRECTLSELKAKGWGYIIYGYGGGHHTEAYVPSRTDDERTVGHGSAPVSFGTIHLFRSDLERYFIFDP